MSARRKFISLALKRGVIDDECAAELGRKRVSARNRAIDPAIRSKPTADTVAYTRHVQDTWRARGHRPRAQSKRSLRRQRERRDSRRIRYQRRQRQLLERWTTALVGAGQRDAAPRGIPLRAWRAAQLMGDGTAAARRKATQIFLAQLPPWYRDAIRHASIRPQGYAHGRLTDREHRLDAQSAPAQRTLQLGILLWLVSEPTRRRGFARVARGLGRGVYRAMLQDWSTGARPALCTVFGADARTEMPGAARALACGRVCHYSQPPPDRCTAADRGPSGWAYNVYWLYGPPVDASVPVDDPSGSDGAIPDPDWWTAVLGGLSPPPP